MRSTIALGLARQLDNIKLVEGREKLVDSFGRCHDYLRLSLTERCNLRCQYCMPKEGVALTPRDECLNLDEMKRLSNLFVQKCGINKIRLTGGEPTIDSKMIPLLNHLKELRKDGLAKVAITTNGMSLDIKSAILKDLG